MAEREKRSTPLDQDAAGKKAISTLCLRRCWDVCCCCEENQACQEHMAKGGWFFK